ncbi:hypothetical protein [Phytoactinopolyspora endophytica]|uniref:hypothetical protein n=1 Tax=Phytoactinopolyspora endophytica TaxID=1642495 RepID=UPI00101D49D7|nr:hypothetical protein [Phytoactinopolyspora endophytica]
MNEQNPTPEHHGDHAEDHGPEQYFAWICDGSLLVTMTRHNPTVIDLVNAWKTNGEGDHDTADYDTVDRELAEHHFRRVSEWKPTRLGTSLSSDREHVFPCAVVVDAEEGEKP